LDAEDGYLSRDRWSYPLLADGVRRWSSRPQQDCAELFRRTVFKEIQRIASVIRTWRDSFAAGGVASKDIEYSAPAMLPPSFLSDRPSEPVG
jgi:hypothetical protein